MLAHHLTAPLVALVLCVGCSATAPSAQDTRAAETVATPVPTPVSTPVPTPVPTPLPSPTAPVVVARGDGRLTVVPGTSRPVGAGPLRRYAVEVEGGLGVDPAAFARVVERTLADPRSWTGQGGRALQRVDGEADLRVALVSPGTVDRLCAPLRTNGRFSCAKGDRAVLNVARWQTGASAYAGMLQDYRSYLVNHEVGHVLGAGHTSCPGPGQVAPVMLQQTLGLDGCRPGPWPHP